MVRHTAAYFGIMLLLFPLAGCPSSATSPPASGTKSPDLKWARSVADEFLRAVKDNDAKAAYGLLAADYRDRLSAQERKEGFFDLNTLRGGNSGKRAWTITSEELAPNGMEAKFTGELTVELPTGPANLPVTERYPVTLLVTRWKESDLWRVNLFRVGEKK